jgi:predicted nucleotidyltransferase
MMGSTDPYEALPVDIELCLRTLSQVFERCPGVVFAYLFGGAGVGRLRPLSDVDLAAYVEETRDLVEGRPELLGAVTAHLGTDKVELVVLNTAPISVTGRVLQTRRVIYDRDPCRRHRFEAGALREFFDFRIFEHRLLARRYGRG